MKIDNIKDFDLAQTLDCGQAFRWKQLENGAFEGIAYGKKITLSIVDDVLEISGCNENDFAEIWEDYFDLKRDYSKIKEDLSKIHPEMKNAIDFAPGIRILYQEPWEALCSFIISQNNRIPRIKEIIQRLCENFGDDIGGGFSFPSAEKIASLTAADLAPLRAGFRDKYIIDASQKIASGEINLDSLKTIPVDDAREELKKIKGVGDKVANCTLLFGLHRLECFPQDVWIKRAMEQLFPTLTPQDFGEYGGIAQQYIFHYLRSISR